jgi:hypothetical protein
MKPSRLPNFLHPFPLVDYAIARAPGNRIAHDDCLSWLKRHRYATPPKSACIGCPYHSDAYWRELQRDAPDADAVTVDRAIRQGLPGIRDAAFLHRSRRPLGEVNFATAADLGQQSLFGNECEGVCAL